MMEKYLLKGIIPCLLCIIVYSCVPYKKTILIQDTDKRDKEVKMFETAKKVSQQIEVGDELYINVTSSDERATNFSARTIDNSTDITLRSYTVDNDGYIRFPYLGKVFVLNKSLDELSAEIENSLGSYLLTPSVFIKFVNKKITVLGEVSNPGVYNFYDKNINVMQAIAYAGDVTAFGNRTKIALLREIEGKIFKYRLDLTNDNLLLSELYIVQPNDIIYVEPLRIKRWGFETFPYTLIFTVINTALILWTFTLTTLY